MKLYLIDWGADVVSGNRYLILQAQDRSHLLDDIDNWGDPWAVKFCEVRGDFYLSFDVKPIEFEEDDERLEYLEDGEKPDVRHDIVNVYDPIDATTDISNNWASFVTKMIDSPDDKRWKRFRWTEKPPYL